MCTSAPGTSVLISTPAITSTPNFAPAAWASATPAVESWSVMAMTLTASLAARETSCAGVCVPSEAVVWV